MQEVKKKEILFVAYIDLLMMHVLTNIKFKNAIVGLF